MGHGGHCRAAAGRRLCPVRQLALDFLVNLPIGVLALGLIGRFLHERRQLRRPRIDWAGAALVLLALGALIVALLEGGQAWAWGSAPSLALLATAAAALAALVWVEGRAAEPVMPGWLWRDRALAGSNLVMIAMGLAMMAPSIYLPTLLQSVQGLGAIAAGLVLASLSLGWPAASALSARLYLRIGYRDTALLGAALALAAALGFRALPQPQPVWAVVLDQLVLGAGFGLLSTALLVGAQSVVGWQQRGVVTGGNMFARYLGQSLGAAVFGALFNHAMGQRLAQAPPALRGELPAGVDSVLALLQGGAAPAAVQSWLKAALAAATSELYVGMAVAAVFMAAVLLAVPRRFAMDGVAPRSG
ncbi:MFS transporter [Ottowia pentelensis]|uniref:MFS transporter n=1 Tax=Ottowia pentelensis TaxID=511108 RepID=UPI003634ED04